MELRPAENYGDVTLSIQASRDHYCTPRIDDLPLDNYEEAEIALLLNGQLIHPRRIGIMGFDELFEKGTNPVAGYVSWDDVNKLRDALRKRQGMR
jgi:hypothetical protein